MLKTYIPFISIYLKFYISSIQYINILAGSGFINQGVDSIEVLATNCFAVRFAFYALKFSFKLLLTTVREKAHSNGVIK